MSYILEAKINNQEQHCNDSRLVEINWISPPTLNASDFPTTIIVVRLTPL